MRGHVRALGGGANAVTQTRSLRVSNAGVLTLPTIPLALIPAPGAGKCIMVSQVSVHLNWVADYSGFDINGELKLMYSPSLANASGSLDNTFLDLVSLLAPQTFLGVGVSLFATIPGLEQVSGINTIGVTIPVATIVNAGVDLVVLNGGVDYGGGDPGNVLTVSALYSEFSI
jgi:hypothetical protein